MHFYNYALERSIVNQKIKRHFDRLVMSIVKQGSLSVQSEKNFTMAIRFQYSNCFVHKKFVLYKTRRLDSTMCSD